MRSSQRFKKNIATMGNDSARIMKLRPVSFSWRSDQTDDIQWGLIAEEVYQVLPELVEYDDSSLPFAVKYEQLSVLLLNELKKMTNRVASIERQIEEIRRHRGR